MLLASLQETKCVMLWLEVELLEIVVLVVQDNGEIIHHHYRGSILASLVIYRQGQHNLLQQVAGEGKWCCDNCDNASWLS